MLVYRRRHDDSPKASIDDIDENGPLVLHKIASEGNDDAVKVTAQDMRDIHQTFRPISAST